MDAQTANLLLNMPAHFYAGIIIGLIAGLAGGYFFYGKSIRFYQGEVKHLKDELSREVEIRQKLNDDYAKALLALS